MNTYFTKGLLVITLLLTLGSQVMAYSTEFNRTGQSKRLLLPGICDLNPDLSICKKHPICSHEDEQCEDPADNFCFKKRQDEFIGICKIN